MTQPSNHGEAIIYPYRCLSCSHEFEIIKSVAHLNDPEACQKCGAAGSQRYISTTHFYGASDWDKAEYNPGLGQITKNAKHRAEVAKQKGLIEVGNEDFDKTCDSQDKKAEENVAAATKDSYDALTYGLQKDYLAKR